jgi:hypothetical protein
MTRLERRGAFYVACIGVLAAILLAQQLWAWLFS